MDGQQLKPNWRKLTRVEINSLYTTAVEADLGAKPLATVDELLQDTLGIDCKANAHDELFESLDLSCHDTANLFRLIRMHSGVKTEPTSVLNYNRHIYRGQELPHAWGQYFVNLATPSDATYDHEYKGVIAEQYSALLANIPTERLSITLKETVKKEVISTLKLGKVAGPNGVDPEHLVYGGNALIHH